ncbi:cubilin homolog [Uranotaenia lowii]|uniref:cubilin homolog n=1 Tax=Uranotaenia lowii TaxID=190385 RepID=UPI00247B0E81|nr:cubilin homolog [Uranotaenia lowii]
MYSGKMFAAYINLCVAILWTVQVNCYYENQPKILTSDGHLIIESAVDRNISITLKGNGFLNVGDLSLRKVIQSLGNVTSGGTGDSPLPNLLDGSAAQLRELIGLVKGPNGLFKRVADLENGTSAAGGGRERVRIFNINRRLQTLETKVKNIANKLRENNCKTSPCQNGGSCISLYDSFVCQCPKNWEGPTCATDVNECSEFAGTDLGCQNGATCKNTPGGYSCICASGWQGIHCNSRNKDCMTSGSELCGHGTCVQTKEDPGFKCICEQGWKTNGVTPACTIDVDECTDSRPHCSKDPEVSCINLPGSFVCGGCPPGYSGNGFYCVDIDECEINNGGCSTSPSVTCINLRGSSKCGNCPPGYTGDGKICEQRGSRCTPGMCHPLARCVDYPSGINCICPSGYQGSGFGPSGCLRTPVNPCLFNPCRNGGTCTAVGNNYTCTCPQGTALPNCMKLINSCVPNPCMNGGTCTPVLDRFVCSCPSGYTGQRCQGAARACGGILDSHSGILKHPIDNGTYNHNARCAWLIKTNHTKVLNITFSQFNVENAVSTGECKFDWLQIHDGRTSAAHVIGRFCGNTLPRGGNIISTHNVIYLWFRSDNSTAHDGFELRWDSIDPVCGGEIAIKSHGVLTSPGSPGSYPPNRDCKWFLTAPPGKRIQFHFFTMKIEAHNSCEYDFLQINDGVRDESTMLVKFCNTTHPEPLVTPSNEATVYFHSDEDSNDAGFQISYAVIEGIPGCGGIFTKTEGEISSPRRNEDNFYPHNLNCEYLIQLPAETKIEIKFNRFHLEASDSCKFDYVAVFDGRTVDAPSLGKFCGDRIPAEITSSSNNLLLLFRSDWSTSHGGFSISYKVRCGGVITDPNTEIVSPGYPRAYGSNQLCDYLIQGPVGKAIKLDFSDFDIEGNSFPNCDLDYVAIYDGYEENNNTRIGKYCSAKTPPQALSTLNVMLLRFVSDVSINGRGFKANFSFVDVACGGILKSDDITIRIDQGTYLPDTDCRWVIVAPKTHAVQLSWNSFELEKSSNCLYDFVEIYDNSTKGNSSFVGRYCGTTKPPAITSAGNIVTIRFRTDSSNAKDGFVLSFSFIDVQKMCGGNFFTSTGIIKSPGFPGEYTASKVCEWTITVPMGQQIRLDVKSFTMEKHSNCRFDGLEIRNGGTANSPLIGKYCGTDEFDGITSFGNKLYLKFYSDASRNYAGFEIEWDGTATGCGGVLTSPRGSIISPNYPEPYGNRAQCTWRISVSEGSAVHIVFSDLELESHPNCRYDYLEVFDGKDVSSKSMGRYCTADTDPIQLDTSTNHALVKMRTDDTNHGRGFHLKYNIVCKRNLTGFSGVIESPNFPNKYSPGSDCLWTITVPRGNKIDLEFSHFELENGMTFDKNMSHVCHFDYVEIIETKGESTISRKYCNHMPAKMTSKGSSISVAFRTDTSGETSGFRLEWQINGCGGILTKPVGTFSTPNYPNEYPVSTHCHWTISMPVGYVVEVMIQDFNMEASGTCRYDGLAFSNTEDFSQVITEFCHTQREPVKLISSGHMLYAKFFSDQTYTYKGFTATYRMLPAKCGGLITSHQGVVYSPNYPRNYPSNSSCEWTIQTNPAHTLQLTFEDIGIVRSDNCTKDYVKVYDGPIRDESKLLMTICDSEANVTSAISSGYRMLVVFQSDEALEAKGFRANFTTNCGAKINVTQSGIISLENTFTIRSENCTWILMAEQLTQHITLQVMHMNVVEVEGNCLANLTIHDGDSIEAPIRYAGCGSKSPPALVSNGNSLTIHITSEDFNLFSLLGTQFVASYTTLENACGGTLTSFAGEFASPNYPNTYPLNVECVWQLTASPGNSLQLYMESLNIPPSDDCNSDYLEIREESGSGKLIGDYCGDNPAINLTSSNSFWVKLKTSNQNVGKGFLASYSYDNFNEITGRSGVITSPLYPRDYARSEVHTWRVIVDVGSIIAMKFSVFEIDVRYLESCEGQLEIYDGYDDSAEPLHEELCGLSAPEPFKSTSNVIFMRLDHTDSNGPSKFMLKWEQIGKQSEQPEPVSDDEQHCGGHQVIALSRNMTSFDLISPGYPTGYRTNLNCSWIFQSAFNTHHPVLKLSYVDLDETDACLSDYLEISTSQDMFTWSTPERICTFGLGVKSEFHGKPFLKVQFKTDYFTNRTGFTGVVDLLCGGYITEPNGVIEVPYVINETASKRPEMNCMWNITVRPGRIIEFKFESIKIERTQPGPWAGFVVIKNGIDEFSPLLGTFSGSEIPPRVNTSSNRAFVKFSSGFDINNQFKLVYREIGLQCGGRIILQRTNSTVITSPNFPEVPHPHSECVWTIMAPAGETMKFEFEQFTLKYSSMCSIEYVELRDGGTSSSALMAKSCGSESIASRLTTSNMLRIRYFTDVTDPGNGFKLRVTISQCGGSLHTPKGTIYSRNYPIPGGYPTNTVCEYYILGRINTILNITFQDFHLPTNPNCSLTDNVKIYSLIPGENATSELLGTYCGSEIPSSILSENNQVKIVFTTFNPLGVYRGFKLSYVATPDQCGSEIIAPSGDIVCPGYPDSCLKLKKFCEWKITAPIGRRVKIEFLDLDFATAASYQQRLGFYHGFDFSSRIQFVMGNYDKKAIYSSGNQMMINFWSRLTSSNRGFKLHFSSDEPSLCVGSLDNDQGIIATPINQTSYSCEYKRSSTVFAEIDGHKVGTMALYFEEIKAGNYQSACSYNHNSRGIFVRRNAATNDRNGLLRKYCGNGTKSDLVRSPFPDISIVARQGAYLGEVRFKLNYQVHNCGGIFGNSLKNITRPYLGNTKGPLDCAWYLDYPENTLINIEFVNFNLNQSCEDEYLLIYNGPSTTSPLLGTFCKGTGVETIATQGRYAFIEYHSQNYNSSGNFELKLDQMVSGCGGTLHKSVDIINSPNVGGKYQPNTECIWTLQADNGFHIGAYFIGRYNLQKSENCSKDYLEFFDRVRDKWVSLGRVCGKETPKVFNSTGSLLRVVFRTDDLVEGDGFTLKWEQNCGGIYNVDGIGGVMVSPNYPMNYNRMMVCNYTFVAAEKDSYISLNFLDFSLEDGAQTSICLYDNITIYKQLEYYEPVQWEKVATYCKKDSPGRLRHKTRIAVIFKSDRWLEARGFKFEYKMDTCGGTITESKRIESPNLTGNTQTGYNNAINCIWNITIPSGKKVVVRFEDLEIEHSEGCYFDTIEVYKGLERKPEDKLVSLCGNLTAHAPAVSITGGHGAIYFKSEQYTTVTNPRFSALVFFVDDCDRQVTLDSKNPTYNLNVLGSNNKKLQDCQYIIKAPDGYGLQINFDQFHLGSTRNVTDCSDNFVEIRDGSGPFAELVGKYCGFVMPPLTNTFTTSMFVRLVTDSYLKGTGFAATISLVESPCGIGYYNLTEKREQELKSPNFGIGNYPPNNRCMWLLEVYAGKTIEIEFHNFQLQAYNNEQEKCPDKLEIFDANVKSFIYEGLGEDVVFRGSSSHAIKSSFYHGTRNPNSHHIYCGRSELPATYHSSSSKIYVKFESDASIDDRGFKLTARQTDVCARNYTRLQGRINSNYMTRYEKCTVTIQVPKNYTISLYFGLFYTHTTDCNEEGVKIYDGLDTENEIAALCGFAMPGPIFSTGNVLRIDLPKSKTEYATTVFDATFVATDKGRGCGGEIFNYGGQFSSPLYPNNNRTRMECLWTVTVPTNMYIALKFDIFDMGSKNTCNTDYVQLIEVSGEEKKVIRQHCGGDTPAVFIGKSSVIQVLYKQTQNFGGTGWQAKFMAIEKGATVNDW